MTGLPSRYACPSCGGGLSRTSLYPRAEVYELQFPASPVPVLRICLILAALGFGLALVHIALSMMGMFVAAIWVGWKYFSALQCDVCRKYYVSGQFADGKGQRIPWRKENTRQLRKNVFIAILLLLGIFLPIYMVESQLATRCSSSCSELGLRGKADLQGLRCSCGDALQASPPKEN